MSPDDRNMTEALGFTGQTNFTLADQFLIWRGDDTTGGTSYDTYYLLFFSGVLEQWTEFPDGTFTDQSGVSLFRRDTATLFKMMSDHLTHSYPPPWSQ